MTPRASDCGGLRLFLANTEVLLRASGALWIEHAQTLVVADLHFEKGSAYAMRGQMLPPYDTDETLTRLEAELVALSPIQLILLGDSFHDSGGGGRLTAEARARVEALADGRRLVWAVGNHDAEGLGSLPGEVAEIVEIGGLTLRHDPLPGERPGEIAGHLHPCAKVAGKSGSVRRRAFATDGQRLILPAFGAFTGGLNLLDEAFRGLFGPSPIVAVLGRARLHAVGWRSLRGD